MPEHPTQTMENKDHYWITLRHLKTVLVLLSYLAVGYSDSLLGVNMTQFELALRASTEEVSRFIPIAFGGFTLGNMLLSLSKPQGNLQIVYITCILLLGVCNIVIPLVTSFGDPNPWTWGLLFPLFFLTGSAGGTIEAASIARLLILWGKESVTPLQLLDLAYGVGAIIGPFACQPFLLEVGNISDIRGSINASYSGEEVKIIYPYSFVGVFAIILATFSILTALREWSDSPHPTRLEGEGNMSDISTTECNRSSIPTWKRRLLLLLASLTYAYSNGMGMIEQGFLTKYVTISGYGLDAKTGASMGGTSWIVHIVSAVLFVFIIRRIGMANNLILAAIILTLSNLLLVVTTASHVYLSSILWSGIIGMAVGGCTFFACLVSFLEGMFSVSPRDSSFYLIPNCVGNIVWPLLVGRYIESLPDVFIYTMAGCGFASCLTVVCLLLLSRSVR